MKIRIAKHADLVEFEVTGEMDASAIVDHITEYFQTHDDRCVLWNLLNCDLSALSPGRFREIAAAAGGSLKSRQPNPRAALFAESRSDQLLLTAFTALAETASDLPMNIFEDRDVAIAWLVGPS